MFQDPMLPEPLQLGAGLEGRARRSAAAGLRVGLEGIALPAGRYSASIRWAARRSRNGVLLHERAELGNERFLTAEAQVSLDAQLQGIEAFLLQSRRSRLDEPLVLEVLEDGRARGRGPRAERAASAA